MKTVKTSGMATMNNAERRSRSIWRRSLWAMPSSRMDNLLLCEAPAESHYAEAKERCPDREEHQHGHKPARAANAGQDQG